MGWINSHVVTTKPITDIKGNLIPKGTEFIVIYGSKRENCNVASFRSCENGKVYRFPWEAIYFSVFTGSEACYIAIFSLASIYNDKLCSFWNEISFDVSDGLCCHDM